ncbi:MAG: hypothetical protein WHT65_00225 [Pseudothermotoga sp.]
MEKITTILIVLVTSVCVATQFNFSGDLYNSIEVANLLVNLKKDDLQIGFLYKDSRATYTKLGFLRMKSSDTTISVGGSVGRSWTAQMRVEANSYGLAPGQYYFDFVISPERSYSTFKISQKVFFGNNVLNLSDYERVGDPSAGFTRIYARFQNREIGVYRLNEGIFAGFFPYTIGQTGEEGFFMGAGWMNGFSGFFAFRSRWVLSNSSIFVDPFVIIKTDSAVFGVRTEIVGPVLKGDLLFTGRQVFFSVSF